MTSPSTTPTPQQQPPFAPSASSLRGRFLWHELLARDVAAAAAFYPPVTGWTVQEMSFPGAKEPYTIFAQGAAGRAGAMAYPAAQVAAGAKAMWLPYLGTDSVDATAREAVALGATQLMPPTDIPTVGRMAVLMDPQGAQFALFTPFPESTPEVEPQVGEFAWHEMMADDPDAAFDFYSRLFGWTKTHAMDMGADGVYQMYGRGAFTYGGFGRRPEGSPPTLWNSYIRVADLDASCEALKRNGGSILMGPHEVPNDDRIVVAVDNQGAMISLVGKVRK
jgi:predicted enzyme related to lactoylglutathione lyase